MNPDSPKTPREEMEARLTALLLGELSAAESAAVRELIAHDAELARLHDRLQQAILFVREAVPADQEGPTVPAEPPKLSEERRKKLLTSFAIPPLKPDARKPKPFFQMRLIEVLAVVTIIGALTAMLFPSLNAMKRKRPIAITRLPAASARAVPLTAGVRKVSEQADESPQVRQQVSGQINPANVVGYVDVHVPKDSVLLPGLASADSEGDIVAGGGIYLADASKSSPKPETAGPSVSFSTRSPSSPSRSVNGTVAGNYSLSTVQPGSPEPIAAVLAPASAPPSPVQIVLPSPTDAAFGDALTATVVSEDTVASFAVPTKPAESSSRHSSASVRAFYDTSGLDAAPVPALETGGESITEGRSEQLRERFAKALKSSPSTDVNGKSRQAAGFDWYAGNTLLSTTNGTGLQAGTRSGGGTATNFFNRGELALGTFAYGGFAASGNRSGGISGGGGTGGGGGGGTDEVRLLTRAESQVSDEALSAAVIDPATGLPMSHDLSLVRTDDGVAVANNLYLPGLVASPDAPATNSWGIETGVTRQLAEVNRDKVPVLGDLPLVGQLFRSSSQAGSPSTIVTNGQTWEFAGYDDPGQFIPQGSIASTGSGAAGIPVQAQLPVPRYRLKQGNPSVANVAGVITYNTNTYYRQLSQLGVEELGRTSTNVSSNTFVSRYAFSTLSKAGEGTLTLSGANTFGLETNSSAYYAKKRELEDLKSLRKHLGIADEYAVGRLAHSNLANGRLALREIRVDPKLFLQGLESMRAFAGDNEPKEQAHGIPRVNVAGAGGANGGAGGGGVRFLTRTNSMEATHESMHQLFSRLGYRLNTNGKSMFFNDRAGILLVNATPDEADGIERIAQALARPVTNGKAPTAPIEDRPALRTPTTNAPIPQPEIQTSENNFSTFSLNVSDVSFKLAMASLEKGQMPDAASIRSEEFINAFDYRDPEPAAGAPIAFAWERARFPFAHNRDLLRFSLKTAALGRQAGRPLNVVLLLDNSGSMERADRVQIIREALHVLAEQLQRQDKLSVIMFARTARLVADGVSGDKASEVAEQVSGLTPQGGTNLEDAMNLAYQTAAKHYLANGINRVVLLTDGAANLGDVEPESLKNKVETHRRQGIALDCFGIGWEGFNDDLLEILSRNGDGRYGFINSPEEAATEFAGQLAGALKVAASDVKVQVEFNPKRVTSYRQIGYAKHQLTKEQFRDNTVDAAEIAAQEAGNALYTVEVNPTGEGPLCTVRVRYKIPGTTDYREQAWDVPFTGNALSLEQSSPAMRLAASASSFAEWLVASPFAGEVTPDRVLGVLSGVPEIYGADARPRKLEWMIRQAKSLEGK